MSEMTEPRMPNAVTCLRRYAAEHEIAFSQSFYQQEYKLILQHKRRDGVIVNVCAAATYMLDGLEFRAGCSFRHRQVSADFSFLPSDAPCADFCRVMDEIREWADRQIDPDNPSLSDAEAYLFQLLNDENPVIRTIAAERLGYIGGFNVVSHLLASATGDTNDDVRTQALAAIIQMESRGVVHSDVVDSALDVAVSDPAEWVRNYAAAELKKR